MLQVANVSFSGIGLQLVTTLLALWVGGRISHSRSYWERAWDRKADAYSMVLEAVNRMRREASVFQRDLVEYRDRDQDDIDRRVAIYRQSRDVLFDTIAREAWILPSDVQTIIELLDERLSTRHESYWESVDSDSFATKQAFADVLVIAREDMKIPRLFERPAMPSIKLRRTL
jgi:hypothetical protein